MGNYNNSAIQLIFCVETNKRADTDSIYIKETVDYLYFVNNKIKISKVYMGTKSKYKSKDVIKEINDKIKAFTIGITKVIYCIDTDDYEKNVEHKKELDEIIKFCKDNNYDLIWFCHNVEEDEAGAFRRKKKMEEMKLDKLSSEKMLIHSSNILSVLDKYLLRKNTQ